MEAPTDAGPASSGTLLQPLYYRTLSTPKEEFLEKLKRVKPAREMEAGDADLLDGLVSRIKKPTEIFQGALRDAVHFLMASLAYCYDVEELPSGAKVPRGILLEEIDVFIDAFEDAIGTFDYDTSDGFRSLPIKAVTTRPRPPRFSPVRDLLVSSFLLGFRQAAIHILEMLRYTRLLVEARQRRKDRRRIYWPRLADWMEWLYLGGEHDAMVLPKGARRSTHSAAASTPEKAPKTLDADELSLRTEHSLIRHITRDTEAGRSRAGSIAKESQASKKKKKKKKKKKSVKFKDSNGLKKPSKSSWIMTLRGRAADAVEWVRESDDVEYAFKLVVAVALVTWPAFLPSWQAWYVDIRGLWAPLQLVLVFEVSIGTSLIVFFMRLGGVIVGCTTGYIAYLAGHHILVLAIIVQMLVIIPSAYIQLETKYVKAGIVCITSSAVVTCASFSNSKSAVAIYYTRLASFLIGGTVAILVEVCLYPVRARDRLIQSLSSAIQEILRVQGAVSIGIDDPDLGHHSARAQAVFTSSRNRTRAALAAAETFLPFCELNPLIYTYRRNVAGGVTISIFAVNEALTTRLPLPQFLPSNRTAQLRLITRVREVVATRRLRDPTANISRPATPTSDASSLDSEEQVSIRHRVLSWNAETAGQMEIIEYIEELVELAKLLVGVNAFRGGMLEKPDLGTYIRGGKRFADPAPAARAGQAQVRAQAPAFLDIRGCCGQRRPASQGRHD
ncbi:unnamed protein product [Parascedosporium putredinis]|uniref:Integral membrane bound transporter domain-containing protein n=1 Tax=Parascedosporium putredinis TaxID=1442378 RepID=A0A9P1M566_9PEZI|nr:unnamed protein product [Parascedosporium putredinis]CAI7987774.1 unnamed protein product [Parascedosporium putredinis]